MGKGGGLDPNAQALAGCLLHGKSIYVLLRFVILHFVHGLGHGFSLRRLWRRMRAPWALNKVP